MRYLPIHKVISHKLVITGEKKLWHTRETR